MMSLKTTEKAYFNCIHCKGRKVILLHNENHTVVIRVHCAMLWKERKKKKIQTIMNMNDKIS